MAAWTDTHFKPKPKKDMAKNKTKMTAGADAAPGKKYKLSEIIAALIADDVELDAKGILAYCNEDETGSRCNLNFLAADNRTDLSMNLIHLGCSQLMVEAMNYNPVALGIFAQAHGRAVSKMIARSLGVFSGKFND